jgi:hypothetical protein
MYVAINPGLMVEVLGLDRELIRHVFQLSSIAWSKKKGSESSHPTTHI